jgi:caffeoyl-CoA O-methyltransferase
MPDLVPPEIEAYAAAHTTPPPPALARLAAETDAMGDVARMMTGPLEGRFLELLAFALRPRLVLEIGTFTGYSALSMAAALPAGARLVTCDVDAERQAITRRHAVAAGLADRIELRLGPALDTIASLDGPFDLVFIDADKSNYTNYYEAVLPKLAEGGVVAVDNTLWSGRVLDASDTTEDTLAIRHFNDRVAADPRVICVMLTVRDGVTLIRRRPGA